MIQLKCAHASVIYMVINIANILLKFQTNVSLAVLI